MVFTSKVCADYTELVNDYLDRIYLDSIEDFNHVQEALAQLKAGASDKIPPSLKERLTNITNLLESPEEFVEYRQDDEEFLSIVHNRIAAKVHDISVLSLDEKQKILEEQKRKTEEIKKNHEIMISRTPPPPPPPSPREFVVQSGVYFHRLENSEIRQPVLMRMFDDQADVFYYSMVFFPPELFELGTY